jgi:glycosyltransferase involved in cell wall biosynthesis
MNHSKDLVTVVIPTYNRAHLLPRAIESVLNQTYQNIELIIVEDCFQDNTQEVVNNYRTKDKRVFYIRNEKHLGAAYARNLGIEHSRGAFLMFLDDDCEYLPESIEEYINLMHSLSPQPSIIYSNMWNGEKDGETLCTLKKKGKFISKEDILNRKYIILGFTPWFCKSEIIKKLGGFDVNFHKVDDLEFLIRFLLNGESLYFFNKPLAIWHLEKGISQLDIGSAVYRLLLLEKHFSKIKKYKKFVSYIYWRTARDYFNLGFAKEARYYCWKAFISYPIKIEYLYKTILFAFKKSKIKPNN